MSGLIHCFRVTDGVIGQIDTARTEDHYFYIYTGGKNSGNAIALSDISFSKDAMIPCAFAVINQNNYANPQNPWWMQMHSPEITQDAYIGSVGVAVADKYNDNGARYIACGIGAN